MPTRVTSHWPTMSPIPVPASTPPQYSRERLIVMVWVLRWLVEGDHGTARGAVIGIWPAKVILETRYCRASDRGRRYGSFPGRRGVAALLASEPTHVLWARWGD